MEQGRERRGKEKTGNGEGFTWMLEIYGWQQSTADFRVIVGAAIPEI